MVGGIESGIHAEHFHSMSGHERTATEEGIEDQWGISRNWKEFN